MIPASEEGYAEYERQVKQLQKTQLSLLRWLVDGHGLREVFQEAVSEATLREFIEDNQKSRERWRKSRIGAHSAGAIRDLLISKPCLKLRPAEDEQAYQAARQAALQGIEERKSWHGPEWEEREAAIVHNLLSRTSCAVIVLGGGHDLSKHVERQGRGRCEYVRVIPDGFPELAKCDGRVTWVSK